MGIDTVSTHWWRAYDDAVDHPKLQLLQPLLFKAWFNLLCLASANGGKLPVLSTIAFKLRITEDKARHIVAELTARGLIDECNGRFTPHNWNGRQFKSDVTDPTNAERQRRYRGRHAVTANTVTPTVTVTPPRVQSTEAETETERKKDSSARKRAPSTKNPLPDDWRPEGNLSADEEHDLEKMRDWARAQAIRRADWQAQWRNWRRNDGKFNGRPTGQSKQTLSDLAFELADEARERELEAGVHRSDDPFGSH